MKGTIEHDQFIKKERKQNEEDIYLLFEYLSKMESLLSNEHITDNLRDFVEETVEGIIRRVDVKFYIDRQKDSFFSDC